MILAAALLATGLSVLPADRLAMADRLFNRGDYVSARTEYLALVNVEGVDRAKLLYRIVKVAHCLKDLATVRSEAAKFLAEFPGDAEAARVRFYRALAGTPAEQAVELKALDDDSVPKDIRVAALCRLGLATGDDSCFIRCLELDPNGPYSGQAKNAHATHLMKSADPAVRRQAVAIFMDLVLGKDPRLARESLYAVVYLCYTDRRFGEAESLAKRFLKDYSDDKRAGAVRRMLALSECRLGKYVAALEQATDENDEWMLYVRMTSFERLGKFAEARQAAEKALERFPNGECRKMIDLTLARLDSADAEKSGDKARILETARRTAELSGSAGDRLRLAWAYENVGETQRAEDEYAALARDFPKTASAADALYRRAMSLLRAEKWAPAEVALAEALSVGLLTPERVASAHYWRGISLARLEHSAEAIVELKEALKGALSVDERREARLQIADADFNDGKREAALTAYAELIREGALVRMSAAKIQTIGRLLSGDEARTCAKALMTNESPEWRQAGYALMGDVETVAGNLSAAAEVDRKCLNEPCETDVLAHVSLRYGLHCVREGNAVEGEKVLKRAIELNRDDNEARASAYVGLARAALLRGDTEGAKGYATIVLTLFDTTKAAADAKEIVK